MIPEYKARSKTKEMLAALDGGERPSSVASRFDVSRPYISELIKRYRSGRPSPLRQRPKWVGQTIAKLNQEHIDFVIGLAKQYGVTPPVMARSMLIDAVMEAMEK